MEYTIDKEKNVEEEVLQNGEELETQYKDESVYPMTNIKVERGFYTVFELKRKYDSNDKKVILDSDFQRESVWKPRQKAELIESVLMGLPLPIFYFNEDKKGRLIVIDGRQRLTAVFEYLDDKFALKNLNILPEVNGQRFSQLDEVLRTRIEDYQLQAHVIPPQIPDRIKFDIFDRVNRTGTPLNKQEIRNALYQGASTRLLNRLSRADVFERATGGAFLSNPRMKDRYILLRFLALELLYDRQLPGSSGAPYEYKNDMDDLLGRTMDFINTKGEAFAKELEDLAGEGLANAYFYFGSDGFRLERNGRRTPINMNIFETLMHLAIRLPAEDETIRNTVRGKTDAMLKSSEFLNSIGDHRDSLYKIKERYEMADALLGELEL